MVHDSAGTISQHLIIHCLSLVIDCHSCLRVVMVIGVLELAQVARVIHADAYSATMYRLLLSSVTVLLDERVGSL